MTSMKTSLKVTPRVCDVSFFRRNTEQAAMFLSRDKKITKTSLTFYILISSNFFPKTGFNWDIYHHQQTMVIFTITMVHIFRTIWHGC